MKIVVYIAPCERADAIEAYDKYISPDMRRRIHAYDDDVWLELHIVDGKAEIFVDQNVKDEKKCPTVM